MDKFEAMAIIALMVSELKRSDAHEKRIKEALLLAYDALKDSAISDAIGSINIAFRDSER